MTIRGFENFTPQLAPSAWVDDSAEVIGQVVLGEGSSIWPTSVLRGDINRIDIGARSNVQDGTVIHVTHASRFHTQGAPVWVGDDVTIGHRAVLHACTLESRCLIGMGSLVLDEAVVQSNVILGAGSVVPPKKVLESGFLWLGAPARKVRTLTEEELEYLGYSATYYAELAARHRASTLMRVP
ncbi:MAG: gamma carbonic anhydrase family protein [Gammaproteobacteria bacterium 28-57-27]|nr:MAG: gamma carbonic anhydrase family protein [Gammaproteobacteria bacterium 28-57-27]